MYIHFINMIMQIIWLTIHYPIDSQLLIINFPYATVVSKTSQYRLNTGIGRLLACQSVPYKHIDGFPGYWKGAIF